jgi:hypothetical protein
MIRSQGRYFTPEELKRILLLLKETDMTLSEIAARMQCSRSAVAAINRKFVVREYEGRRSHWVVTSAETSAFVGMAMDN